MPLEKRITGLPKAEIDVEKLEARFTLDLGNEGSRVFVAKLNVLDQVISALGSLSSHLRTQATAKGGTVMAVATEKVVGAHIQRDSLQPAVILQLLTQRQVPYTFALPLEAAVDISARLKSESERSIESGQA